MQQGDADAAAFQTSTPEDIIMTPVELFYQKRFKELEAKMNRFEKRGGSGNAGSQARGDCKERDGKRDDRSSDRSDRSKGRDPPKCNNPKCLSGGKHFGKCFAERDFDC
eukprot:3496737-Rhodomonas_salina.1